jgi:D-glycero-D-manno-heptose 1,7-bisphosphate phosphatase
VNKENPPGLLFDKSWTLFTDRDGVINRRVENDYIKKWDEFIFLEGSTDALRILKNIFGLIIMVTNQQGIGKGILSERDLKIIHDRMNEEIKRAGGSLDAIYYCPDMASENPPCRKPNPGMALEAKKDFPQINFKKSVMIGDTLTDMIFGKHLDMITVFAGAEITGEERHYSDYHFENIYSFAKSISSGNIQA